MTRKGSSAGPMPVSGDVLFLRYHVRFEGGAGAGGGTTAAPEPESSEGEGADPRPASPTLPLETAFENEAQGHVAELLGKDFEVRSVFMGGGGADIVAVVGTGYHVVDNWAAFRENVELLASRLRTGVAHVLEGAGRAPRSVTATWGLTPNASPSEGEGDTGGAWSGRTPGLLLGYLVVSHAVLLAILIWMLVINL